MGVGRSREPGALPIPDPESGQDKDAGSALAAGAAAAVRPQGGGEEGNNAGR
jgi:hypothetical protein